jgi:hypothetical protein
LYCLSFFFCSLYYFFGQTIQWTKEEGQTIQWTKEEDRQ